MRSTGVAAVNIYEANVTDYKGQEVQHKYYTVIYTTRKCKTLALDKREHKNKLRGQISYKLEAKMNF